MPDSRSSLKLEPVTLLAGSEPLLVRDWLDATRADLQASGFLDIQHLHAEGSFDWNELLAEGDMMSLFSERKCRIVSLPSGKPGQQGARVIQQLCDTAEDSCCYIFVVPALDRQSRNSAWCKAIGAKGRIVEIESIAEGRLADWLLQRALEKDLQIDLPTAQFLAERTEGNLVAADQELEKLSVRFASERTLDFETVENSVAESARFSHFLLVDACLAGNSPRALRILRSLQAEGYVTVQLRWALQQALQQLDQLYQARRDGSLGTRGWQRLGIWRSKQRLYEAAMSRIGEWRIERLLQNCATLDRLGKGQQESAFPDQDWRELESLVRLFSKEDDSRRERSVT